VLSRSHAISDRDLGVLHRDEIRDPVGIRELLSQAATSGTPLRRALNRHIEVETALIESLSADRLVLRTRNFERRHGPQVFLTLDLEYESYFFSASPVEESDDGCLVLELPEVIFRQERRGSNRSSSPPDGSRQQVEIRIGDRPGAVGEVADLSDRGLAFEVPDEAAPSGGDGIRVRFLDGGMSGTERVATVRHRSQVPDRRGWVRVGVALSGGPGGAQVQRETREEILPTSGFQRAWRKVSMAQAAARTAGHRLGLTRNRPPHVPVVRFLNERNEHICAIVDGWGSTSGAVAVVIPPAFARTKETLLPLASTIIETFRHAKQPVIVYRIDGIRRRGESYLDPECQAPGKEFLRYTFSQGASDLLATFDHLEATCAPSKILVVTFSASAVEGRHALATDPKRRGDGWICVVGAPDLRESLRIVTGGLDFVSCIERGVKMGVREVLGFPFDMDYAGRDAVEKGLALLEDSRRQLAEIDVPVTWVHAKHDAWMDIERVQDILSFGDSSKRRLIEIPTGHQLRTSQEALDTFGLIAGELGRMATGRPFEPRWPSLSSLALRQTAERARLRQEPVDLKGFWRNYLLGREKQGGIGLMVETGAYRALMMEQIRALHLEPGSRVADLGCGTGGLANAISRLDSVPSPLVIDGLDYVVDAVRKARSDWEAPLRARGVVLRLLLADLDIRNRDDGIPLASGAYDAVVGSLLLSYLGDPLRLLREARRLLKPGGRLVVSALRRDADLSKIYVNELRLEEVRQHLGAEAAREREEVSHHFLNEASRLLDLEERGWFRFWDPKDLAALVREAGFKKVRTVRTFGDPPQAVVAAAVRR
jgi:SAM-dependent methyltransferase